MVQDIADPGSRLLRPAIDAAFSALVEQQLRLDALVTPAHLDVLMKRLRRHPALQVVLDHCGKPDIAAGAFEPWASQVAELAQTTPAFCKLSGLLSQAAPGAGVDDLAPFVGHVFHCFGAGRILWGSDWPVVTAQASYQRGLADVAGAGASFCTWQRARSVCHQRGSLLRSGYRTLLILGVFEVCA